MRDKVFVTNVAPMYIGVDPGASGGLAYRWGGSVVHHDSMPETDTDIFNWFDLLKDCNAYAIIEKVGGYVGKEQPGSRMFNFGVNYGLLRMALTACKIPFEEVVPHTWQKALSIPPRKKDETKTSFKNRLKQKAQQLFPDEKITLSTCDALLIAEYCRRSRSMTND